MPLGGNHGSNHGSTEYKNKQGASFNFLATGARVFLFKHASIDGLL